MVVSVHVVGPPNYDYSVITDKLITQFGDTLLLKYVEDLWVEYVHAAKTISAKTYRQFVTRHGLSTGRQRPVVYIGCGGNPYMDDYINIEADYKFYVDISPQSIANHQFRLKLPLWIATLNADDILTRIHADEHGIIAELTGELAALLTLSTYKSTLLMHRQIFVKMQYLPTKSAKIVEAIDKQMRRLVVRR